MLRKGTKEKKEKKVKEVKEKKEKKKDKKSSSKIAPPSEALLAMKREEASLEERNRKEAEEKDRERMKNVSRYDAGASFTKVRGQTKVTIETAQNKTFTR